MGLYEYMMLDETEQWNVLWDKGIYLTHYLGNNEKCNLYALGDFFVEVELNHKTEKIVGKSHFKAGHLLDKYSGNIIF
ncbi:hypothetical protein [Cellulophaga sp. Asnod2-G02]|uniref:hypothetical protein n=1 Tax=Cellulophaga sp. Asnod2-G02 TaxID=3160572 RepID=UPI00386943DB